MELFQNPDEERLYQRAKTAGSDGDLHLALNIYNKLLQLRISRGSVFEVNDQVVADRISDLCTLFGLHDESSEILEAIIAKNADAKSEAVVFFTIKLANSKTIAGRYSEVKEILEEMCGDLDQIPCDVDGLIRWETQASVQKRYLPRLYLVFAMFLSRHGQYQNAIRFIDRGIELASSIKNDYISTRMKLALAEILLEFGEARQSLEVVEAIEAGPYYSDSYIYANCLELKSQANQFLGDLGAAVRRQLGKRRDKPV